MADYMALAGQYGGLFAMHQHHLAYMQYGTVAKPDRTYFTRARSMPALADYLASKNMRWDLAAPLADRWAPLYSPSEQRRPLHMHAAPLHDVPVYSHLESLQTFDTPLSETPSRPGCSHLYSWAQPTDEASNVRGSVGLRDEHLPLRAPKVYGDGMSSPAGYGSACGAGMAAFDCVQTVNLE